MFSGSYTTGDSSSLKKHLRIHTDERPFKWVQAPIDLINIQHLPVMVGWQSWSVLTPLKKYLDGNVKYLLCSICRCQICSYASRNSSQLVVHLRTHTGDSPFVCVVCNAKFKINSDLKRHQRLHTGEKPYSCEYCDYKCAIKGTVLLAF